MLSVDTIVSTIRKNYPDFTNKQKDIANFMLTNTEGMCFMTLKELSRNTGASEVTLLKFCKSLGCENYNDLKAAFRVHAAAVRKQEEFIDDSYGELSLPESGEGEKNGLLWKFAADDKNNIQEFFGKMDPEEYIKAAEMICSAKNVIVCGRGVSLQLADYLITRLIINRVPCVRINTELNDDINNCIRLMNRDTLLIAISFPDYYFMTLELADHAKKRGVRVLGLTDLPTSMLTPYCERTLCAGSRNRFYLNSLAAPVCMVNMLTIAIAMNRDESLAKEDPRLYFPGNESGGGKDRVGGEW